MRLQGQVIRPEQVETEFMVPASPEFEAAGLPFDLVFQGAWDFVEPSALAYQPDPLEGAVRAWRVEPIHTDGEWLATIDNLPYNPGTNGVFEVGEGKDAKVNATAHVLGMLRKGAIVIQNGLDRRMGPYRDFRARFPYQGGGWFYCYAGVSLRPYGQGRAVPEPDHGWTVGMRRHCVDSGIVPPMDVSVLDRQVRLLNNRLSEHRRAAEAGKLPLEMLERREREIANRIERMRTAWTRQFGDRVAGGPLLQATRDDSVLVDAEPPSAALPPARKR